MSDRDVTALLERVAAHTPHLDVDVPGVVATGRRRVRRRRVLAGSMTIAASAGALWWGVGPGSGLLGAEEITPASVTWQVDEPTTVTILDGVTRGGEVAPLTVTKGPEGSSATFVVSGHEETVVGRPMAGGADLFVGERATVLIWRTPAGEPGSVVAPTTYGSSSLGTVEADGDQLTYWYTLGAADYTPRDIVFHDSDRVWTAGGQVAETVELRDGDVDLTGFELPDLGMIGVADDETLFEVDTTVGVGGVFTAARLPQEAVFARQLFPEDGEPDGVVAGPVVQTRELATADLAVFDWEAGTDATGVQWSVDALAWHDQDLDDPTVAGVEVDPVDVGGRVVVLGETYVVSADGQGWPQLVDAEGMVFLSVSDANGPSDGGVVMWRDAWWPWAPRNHVYFAVEEETLPAIADGAELQDVVTVSGPAGVVTLGAVPARDG
ncbi:hypothetical protein MWU75_12240 [Ornithinimicrobium sp. F0845]|uniref:hypothetical protein n=1 Tax=Ornithinimicrobium sp. F0845 TaxID=2926412 RepID=UPI001FF4A070|nr:hypothetical protein [Ornithinimicrobium sp. F0845]MCK0112909.1 hypothetical protein [Ornithinimicrobium sp. F0845]